MTQAVKPMVTMIYFMCRGGMLMMSRFSSPRQTI
jgi:hypothetical protein